MEKSTLTRIINFYQTKKTMVLISLIIVYWITAIAYSFYLGKALRYPDEIMYFNILGQKIATSHIFSVDGINPTAFYPPIYPLLVGILIMLGSGIMGVRLINFCALFIILVIVYKLLEKQSSRYSSIISVFLILGYPVLFYTAGTLYPQTLGSLLLVLAVYFYWESPLSIRNIFFTGLFLGLSILTIPTFIFVLPFMMIFACLRYKKIITKMLLLAAITILTISPWIIRNYVVFDRFVPFSTNFGINFLIGNSPSTTPNNGVAALQGIQNIIEEANNQKMDEFQRNSFYSQSAINFINKNLVHYVFLYLQKTINFFNFRNELATKSEGSHFKDLILMVTYGFLCLVVITRILFYKLIKPSLFEIFLLLLYICSAFVSASVFTRIRFRLPFDFFLIILASLAIEKFFYHKINLKLPE